MKQGFLRKILASDFAGQEPLPEHKDPTTQVHHFRQFRGNHQDRNTLAGDFIQKMVDLGFCADINATCRFVDDQKVTGACKPLGKRDFLLVSAAQSGGNVSTADTGRGGEPRGADRRDGSIVRGPGRLAGEDLRRAEIAVEPIVVEMDVGDGRSAARERCRRRAAG